MAEKFIPDFQPTDIHDWIRAEDDGFGSHRLTSNELENVSSQEKTQDMSLPQSSDIFDAADYLAIERMAAEGGSNF